MTTRGTQKSEPIATRALCSARVDPRSQHILCADEKISMRLSLTFRSSNSRPCCLCSSLTHVCRELVVLDYPDQLVVPARFCAIHITCAAHSSWMNRTCAVCAVTSNLSHVSQSSSRTSSVHAARGGRLLKKLYSGGRL